MKVLGHLDQIVLERTLLHELETIHRAELHRRTLVIVPTARLARHLQLRLAARREAWLGLDVLHLGALGRRIHETSLMPPLRLASPRLLRSLLLRLLAREPGNGWTRFVDRRPGAVGRLQAAVTDLREACVTADELDGCVASTAQRDLAALYRSYVEFLGRMRERGWSDDAGLIDAGLPCASAYARRYGAIFLHGAYELIGIYLELLRALDRGTPVTVLAPISPGARVSAHAERFAERQLLEEGERIEAIRPADGSGRGDALSVLYDEEHDPPARAPVPIRCHHTQGALAELQVAVRRAIGTVSDGCRPDEIIIAARSLSAYESALEEVSSLGGDPDLGQLPWDLSVSAPLRREPVVRDLLLMLKVVDQGFPRRATAELLRSTRMRWESIGNGLESLAGDRADRWSRRACIIGGLEEWTRDLSEWAGRVERRGDRTDAKRGEAVRLGRALTALRDALQPERDRPWLEHAERLKHRLAGFHVEPDDDRAAEAIEALGRLISEMGDMVDVTGDARPVPFSEMVGWLEKAIDESVLPLGSGRGSGIRVLDIMQLRGLTCERLFVLGMNSGLFPRVPPPEPVLDDGLRRRLRESTGRPLTLRTEAADEERLLLALALGSANAGIELSWQRADEAGKAKTPSLALREVARIAVGATDAERLADADSHWPSHPLHWLEALERRCGLLSPGEAVLLAALRAEDPAILRNHPRFAELLPGLQMLSATESFAPGTAAYDGGVGHFAPEPERYSVSALETLGRCPLRYFFQRVLGVEELDEEAIPLELAPREMGLELHRFLERLYSGLRSDDLFDGASVESLIDAAHKRLDPVWDATVGMSCGRYASRLPLLWERAAEQWKAALRSFLDEDLHRLVDSGWRPIGFEERRERAIDLGDGVIIRLVGRFDRVLRRKGESLVGDYKSSGKLKRRADPTEMLKARALQVPLYRLIAEERPAVELLGVGPAYDFEATDAGKAGRRVRFDGFEAQNQRDGFLESVRVLVGLVRGGRFPLRYDERGCPRCPYEQACRRTHPPTVERERHSADVADYYRLQEKNKSKRPFLDGSGPRVGPARSRT